MGLNRYGPMLIPDERFFFTGIYDAPPEAGKFDLVFSVFTFHYVWHKLEAIQKLYNQMLTENGSAILHFPGYLVRTDELQFGNPISEVGGNEQFTRFISMIRDTEGRKVFSYDTIPYFSDDDDRSLLGKFGNLRFSKVHGSTVDLGVTLQGFAQLPFNDKSAYVASNYVPKNKVCD